MAMSRPCEGAKRLIEVRHTLAPAAEACALRPASPGRMKEGPKNRCRYRNHLLDQAANCQVIGL